MHNRHVTLILAITLLASTLPATTTTTYNVHAQQEMTPTQTFETQEEYTKLAISADGNHISAISNTTDKLAVFNRTHMLWTIPVPGIHSIAMSRNASLIAAAATSGLYLFNTQNPTPQQHYNQTYTNPLITLSDDGSTLALATTSTEQTDSPSIRLQLFETENQNLTWNTTLQGTLETISISGNGNHIIATTNHPGALHLFSKQQSTPVWNYTFGEQSGGTKISNDGNFIITTGGNLTDGHSLRVYRFRRQSPLPNYIKIISELPSTAGIAVASQGTIFTLTFPQSKRLIFFNLDLPPYGYGPGSVLNISLVSQPVAISMSSDGRCTAVGAETGVYIHEYMSNLLNLTKQFTSNNLFFVDVAISESGQYLAVAATRQQNNKHSTIYLFDLQETQDSNPDFLFQTVTLTIIITVGLTTLAYLLHRKQKPQKLSPTTYSTPPQQQG